MFNDAASSEELVFIDGDESELAEELSKLGLFWALGCVEGVVAIVGISH